MGSPAGLSVIFVVDEGVEKCYERWVFGLHVGRLRLEIDRTKTFMEPWPISIISVNSVVSDWNLNDIKTVICRFIQSILICMQKG